MNQSISDYIQLLKLQQSYNLDRPKQDNLVTSFIPFYSESEAINEVITQSYTFLSCKYIRGQYYWEFIYSQNIDLIDNKFLYVLVNLSNFILLKSKLPYYYSWTTTNIELNYPNKNYLLDTNGSTWGTYYLIKVGFGMEHPFIPTLDFTGVVTFLKDKLLYEYKDTIGLYGPQNLLYLSSLRPINLYYPLGITIDSELDIDPYYNSTYNLYGIQGNSDFTGRYIGQYTNSTYNKQIKFWVYKNNTSTFLSEHPPNHNTEGLALAALYQVDNSSPIKLSSNSNSLFNLTQSSNNHTIKL